MKVISHWKMSSAPSRRAGCNRSDHRRILLFVLLLLVGVAPNVWAIEMGGKAPHFKLISVDGVEMTLSSLRGDKNLLLDFGSVFCANCQSALSLLNDIALECADGKLNVAAINEDSPNAEKAFKSVVHGLNLGYRVLLDTSGSVASAYGVTQIPHLVLIDGEGNVRMVHTGAMTDLHEKIQELCAPEKKDR